MLSKFDWRSSGEAKQVFTDINEACANSFKHLVGRAFHVETDIQVQICLVIQHESWKECGHLGNRSIWMLHEWMYHHSYFQILGNEEKFPKIWSRCVKPLSKWWGLGNLCFFKEHYHIFVGLPNLSHCLGWWSNDWKLEVERSSLGAPMWDGIYLKKGGESWQKPWGGHSILKLNTTCKQSLSPLYITCHK